MLDVPYEVFTWVDETVERYAVTGHPELPRALAVASLGSWFRGDLARARGSRRAVHQSWPLPTSQSKARWGWIGLWLADIVDGNPGRAADSAGRAIALSRQAGDTYLLTYVRAASRPRPSATPESVSKPAWNWSRPAPRSVLTPARCGVRTTTMSPGRSGWKPPRGKLSPSSCGASTPPAGPATTPVQAIAGLSALSCAARLGEPVDLGDFAELIDHWQRIGSWSQQWIAVRTLVEMLTRLGRDEAAAVLHGALIGRETAPPIVGADAGRMAQAESTLRGPPRRRTLHPPPRRWKSTHR